MTAANLLRKVQTSGISLFVVEGKLRIEAPKGRLTPALRDEISLHKTEIIEALTSPEPNMDCDVVMKAQHEFRRIKGRLERVVSPGYFIWTASNHPALYREIWRAYDAFDTAERVESLKAGHIPWRDYRRLMLTWARLHVRAIRRHRKQK